MNWIVHFMGFFLIFHFYHSRVGNKTAEWTQLVLIYKDVRSVVAYQSAAMGFMKIVELLLELHLLLNSILFVQKPFNGSSELSRSSFPANFTFGTGSSSYQFEGAYNEDGRRPSIWDTFSHQKKTENGVQPIKDGSNGDVAVDQYHRYKDDVELVKNMGMDAYRFSISWSRVLPNGKISGGVNEKGIQFYNNLINELLSKGLVPYATIFHWDVPQTLEDEYGGFLSSRIIPDFQDFAELCYKEFGDRVKYWVTINEPWTFATYGYNDGRYAPGRCSKHIRNCTYGNSGTEPYIVGHNILLAHAVAVKVYREKFQAAQKGKIGISNIVYWMEPFSTNKNDKDAAKRALDFWFGWFMDPLTYGKYPMSMRSLVRDRLPEFTPLESKMVKGSYDFVGINYYSAKYTAEVPFSSDILPAYSTDSLVNYTTEKNGIPIGPRTACDWLYVYPKGLKDLLLYTKENYGNPVIYITENGFGDNVNTNVLEEILADAPRIDYHDQHLKILLESIEDGANVKGYFAWSFLDNFEWSDGYTTKFGLYYVDLKTMERYPKSSSIWFKKFLLN